ncbi:MAG: NAD(P)-dependent oxidoreductase [Bacilli bacterium]|nr:NAD(P)-dependent oxidoreductase [Bacilli bacterium]MBN2876858.1 NAD(P)-dependent oxidoreductase [Bacilli bacterium]
MKVFLIGGTGLLGLSIAKKLIEHEHEVTTIALPPIPSQAEIPSEMKVILSNFNDISDSELMNLMQNHDIFVFAAGIDDRIQGKSPIYEMYYQYNIAPLKRFLRLAKYTGIKQIMILGSYFSYFDRLWSNLHLSDDPPYIRSRIEQSKLAMSYSDSMIVSVLELPYIFGAQKGREPVWTFLVKQLQKMKLATFYPKGGTTMVTVDQVGVIARIVLENKLSGNIPVGYYDLTWKEMLAIVHKGMHLHRPIITLPKWIYKIVLKRINRSFHRQGFESGLNLLKLEQIMYRNAFIESEDRKELMQLGIPDDDIERAIEESIRLSIDFLKDETNFVRMKTN